ncbi:MAG: MBL fold metallo-hydrolase [Desulfofustis sp. PB-SRB1]|jgi:glyoxylase-like metal-dependent hydrolase (beta-lactamase superfamily II)|nr:MBL fold metallo-hydrolase [Desulfofustis sp. PB-SRB1]MBM1003488.1 MBL fold metallo-hydrolase [Desulfofustis sp. PB-SRB1]HBH29633.1 rhodanese [Desulfofustis sp.]HBH31152.1 rhodanese [Desulfofustis sp.]
MAIFKFEADKLYRWVADQADFVLLDVRNSKDFGRFKVEGPHPITMLNVSYFDFMEIEDQCIARMPAKDQAIRIVCAKEGSAQFVAEILEKHGFTDVGYLAGGIKSWGNLLVPTLLHGDDGYQLYQFIRPGKGSCSYGLIYQNSMMLFDPTRNLDFYLDFARDQGCTITATAETHLQADYIAGSRMIAEQTGASLYANKDDFSGAQFEYVAVADKQDIGFGDGAPQVTVVCSPGHTPGSTMYLIDERYLITGDIIFIKSIGRPDLGGMVDEWSDTLFETIRNIGDYDGSIIILPGHFIGWDEANEQLSFADSLENIRRANQSIYQIDNGEDFLAFIKQNMREQPPEYAKIRRVNANIEQVDDEEAEILDLGKNECAASAYAAQQAA